MYIVKDYEDLEKFLSDISQGIAAAISYDSKVSYINISLDGKITFSDKKLKKELETKKELYVNNRYMILRKSEISVCLVSNCIAIDKMTAEEMKTFEEDIKKVPSYSIQQLSEIVGLTVEQLSKSISVDANVLKNETFYLVEFFKIDDYPNPIRLLQYVRKHSNETEAIQMNAYIQDCNEVVQEYLDKQKDKKIRKNLDGVYLQLFERVIEKVIDFKCLMHVRKLMDAFLRDYNNKNFMVCFKIERVIMHSLEQNSKN